MTNNNRKLLLGLGLIGIILVSACASNNSFRSCHERCINIEKIKIDPNCPTDTIDDVEHITRDCDISREVFLNISETCFDKCLALGDSYD